VVVVADTASRLTAVTHSVELALHLLVLATSTAGGKGPVVTHAAGIASQHYLAEQLHRQAQAGRRAPD
jgi:hypothetical protein